MKHMLDTGPQVINLKSVTYIGELCDLGIDRFGYCIGLGHVVISVMESDYPREDLVKELAKIE